jgi:hypothetical protein
MRYLVLFFVVAGMNCAKAATVKPRSDASFNSFCGNPLPDSMYLKQCEEFLRREIPSYSFSNDRGAPMGYGIADLTDPHNVSGDVMVNTTGFIKFIVGHFYYLTPVLPHISHSFIIYVRADGRLKIFKYLNCPKKGDSLTAVVKFAKRRLRGSSDIDGILSRIRNYRSSVKLIMPTDNYGTGEPRCN